MGSFDTFVWQNLDVITVSQIFELNILATENCLKTTPPANSVLPPNDRSTDVRVAFDNSAFEDCGINNLAAGSDFDPSTDHDVGSNLRTLSNHSSGVSYYAVVVFQAKLLHAFDEQGLSNQVVFRLANIHPKSVEFE